MATTGTTNFRRSTLDRYGDSRDHRDAVEAKVLHRSMTQARKQQVKKKQRSVSHEDNVLHNKDLPICHYGEMVEFYDFKVCYCFVDSCFYLVSCFIVVHMQTFHNFLDFYGLK